MSFSDFRELFKRALDADEPYQYQCRLACGPDAKLEDVESLRGGATCRSQLINVPTGLGKTAAVVLGWLWNRVLHADSSHRNSWPRRLVYCLPMRTLVEQTHDSAANCLGRLKLLWDGKGEHGGKVGLHILMGGEEDGEWDLHPEHEAILVGTQDMLLSRALNRGYGMSRYRWPMHFGLLNNDCLWVIDETQLMGVGVETSAQLDGFRHDEKLSTFGPCPTWWMSATLDETRLVTVDHPKPVGGLPMEKLSDAEQNGGQPHKLITARKSLSPAPFVLNGATKGNYAKQMAGFIKDRHQTGTLTLVVVNRVSRAREVFETLTAGKNPPYAPEKVALIHSRFRPADRERHTRLFLGEGDRIVIATQAVEAGVDVSARLLVTELAPWSSLVQRMGRCNRRADLPDAEVFWVDLRAKDDKDDLLQPYSKAELANARSALEQLADANPRAFSGVSVSPEFVVRPVIRRRDLMDLFDTTPDICGQDLDVSRYIRDGDDNEVQFFWRNLEEDAPAAKEPPPQRDELCRVAIGEARIFLRKAGSDGVWRWDPLDEKWEPAGNPRPGAIYLVDIAGGGYDDSLGWTGDPKDKPTPYPPPATGNSESYRKDPDAFARSWQTIAVHTNLVVENVEAIADSLGLDTETTATLRTASLWHDVGKAHVEFQKALRDGPHQPGDVDALYAKSKNPPRSSGATKPYRGIRHELASALVWLLAETPHAPGKPGSRDRDVVAYLIAAHHGKVRLSIRSLPDETGDPESPDALFARGIWQGDALPAVPLGVFTTPEISLDLSFMQMGEGRYGPSWLARTVALREQLGPFRLAYLETLLRAADARASRHTTAHL